MYWRSEQRVDGKRIYVYETMRDEYEMEFASLNRPTAEVAVCCVYL